MKKIVAIFTLLIVVVSCGKKQGNMIVKGQIKGLKKGVLYLQKKQDTALVSVDSVELFGKNKFQLSDNVQSPEMYFLSFNRNGQKRIMFFGEQGEITINDNIEQFGWKPQIKGSKTQELYEKFKKIDNVYKMKRLDFIAKDLEARAKKDDAEVKRLVKEYQKMRNRRFASTIQFALNHKDSEVAPYIALAELFDANFIYVDSINNSLTDKVKQSTYGKQLQKFVDAVKASQKK